MFRRLFIGLVLSQLALVAPSPVSISMVPIRAAAYGHPMTSEVAAPAREAHSVRSRAFLKLDRSYTVQGSAKAAELARCESTVARTFALLPKAHTDAVQSLTLSFDSSMRRGLAGGNTLILRCVNQPNTREMIAVLVHEVGHVVDTGLLQASRYGAETKFVDRGKIVYSTDPSTLLYGVSWTNNRSFTGLERDVVSGYSLENPYEEFAETYAMYVLHGPLFRFYAAHSPVLKKKYEFMKTEVFNGAEYAFANEKLPPIRQAHERAYDVTRLDYDSESFLALRESPDSN